MRAREFLQEDYNQNLQSDLSNILIGAKGSGVSQVETKDLVNQLYSMGYAVDIISIISLLSNNPVVQNATPEMVVLTSPEGASADNTEDSADRVSDMAQQAVE
jgi:hypothetical protein